MTENADLANVPEATHVPKKRTRVPVVWIIPIVAALVGVGIVVQRYLNEGPTIGISFRTAEGIEPGKTFIKYKDVDIGKVTEVVLSKDFSKVVVTAKMEKHAEGLLVEDSRFWIVKPRITLSGVSGIGTLLSGKYIGIEPGKSGKSQRDFVGLEVPPPITGGMSGREFMLRAATLGSLGIGSPIYYRRLNVGQVIGYDLAPDGTSVDIRIFLDAPYDGYVTSDTRFWESSGIHASMGAGGLSLETESVLSILIGGIRFETPPSATAGKPAPEKSVFTLFDNRDAAMAPPVSESERYVLYFHESLQGTVGRRPRHHARVAGRRSHGGQTRLRSGDAGHSHPRGGHDLPVPCAPAPGEDRRCHDRGPCPGKNVKKSYSGLSRRRDCARNCAPAASSAGRCMSPSSISRTRRRRGST